RVLTFFAKFGLRASDQRVDFIQVIRSSAASRRIADLGADSCRQGRTSTKSGPALHVPRNPSPAIQKPYPFGRPSRKRRPGRSPMRTARNPLNWISTGLAGARHYMLRKITLWSVAGLVLLSLASLGAIGWVGSERALHPEYHQYDWSLATFPDLDPERIQVRSVDNVLLDGRFFRGAHSSLVILASGYGDTQDQMLSIAEFLHSAGFSVLTYNSRGRPPSGGRYVTVGALEQKDVVSVVNYAVGRSDVDANRIGV